MRMCPYCAEQVPVAAAICSHCQQSLAPTQPVSAQPAAVARLYPKAPFDRRLLATLLDAAIACAPLGVVGIVAAAVAWAISGGVAFAIGILVGAPAFLWAAYYGFIKDGQPRGQSIGKKKLGLMVVHLPTNAPCSRSQSALRQLVMAGTNLIPYLGWLVEPIVVLAADGGRRLGDLAADTQVIAVESYRPAA
ncbi:MAG: RDD family protein [Myxococcales bacterium]